MKKNVATEMQFDSCPDIKWKEIFMESADQTGVFMTANNNKVKSFFSEIVSPDADDNKQNQYYFNFRFWFGERNSKRIWGQGIKFYGTRRFVPAWNLRIIGQFIMGRWKAWLGDLRFLHRLLEYKWKDYWNILEFLNTTKH